jgi:hypothetical protein
MSASEEYEVSRASHTMFFDQERKRGEASQQGNRSGLKICHEQGVVGC